MVCWSHDPELSLLGLCLAELHTYVLQETYKRIFLIINKKKLEMI